MLEKDFTFLRIIKGRLNYRRGDLLLYFIEPTQDLLYDSIEIYEQAYDQAYHDGCYFKEDVLELLVSMDIWNPLIDQDIESIKKDMEELKIQAFKNCFKQRELAAIKKTIRAAERKMAELSAKKNQLDHLTCEGVASYARWNWVIENSVYYRDHRKYDWKHINILTAVAYYESHTIPVGDIRYIARNDPWRSMWNTAKKTGRLFDFPTTQYTKDQSLLCSFSSMYDNVYENPEAPDEQVIDDDDCLDGWFIEQRRKMDNEKKKQKVNSVLDKVKNKDAGEVFLFARNSEDLNSINELNTQRGMQMKKERMDMLQEKGVIKSDLEFADVQDHLITQGNKAFSERLKKV